MQVSEGAILTPINGNLEEIEAVSKSYGYFSQSGSGYGHKEFHRTKAPQSPPSASIYKQVAKIESRQRVPTLQVLKTPEPSSVPRNEVQTPTQSKLTLSTDSQTPSSVISNANGKGSHIRKSLRTIGKLINVSEKRLVKTVIE